MIDTHSHIYDKVFEADCSEVVARAQAVGVQRVILANVDIETITLLDEMADMHLDFCLKAMGLHPTSVNGNYQEELTVIKRALDKGDYCAIGEIGIDLYWDDRFLKEQIAAFQQQVEWSLEMDLPVIIHIRKSFAEVFSVLAKFKTKPRGVFHCFSGGIEEAKKAVQMGFFLGIGGVVTYKNSTLLDIVRQIGIEHLLLETDAPYLAPVPYRGKRNEPAYMIEVAQTLASVFGLSIKQIDEITTNNARHLFRF